jgi:hypothetical protein
MAISLCCTFLKCAAAQIFVQIIESSWALDIIFFFQNWLIVFLYATLFLDCSVLELMHTPHYSAIVLEGIHNEKMFLEASKFKSLLEVDT